jgi:hypothetical protein
MGRLRPAHRHPDGRPIGIQTAGETLRGEPMTQEKGSFGTGEEQTPEKDTDVGTFAEGEEQTPEKDTDVGSFGTGEEQTPEKDTDVGTFAEGEETKP